MVYGFTIIEHGEFTKKMYALFNEYIFFNADKLWEKAGIHGILHNSEGFICGQITDELEKGLKYFKDNENELRKLIPSKSESDYDTAYNYLKEITENCLKYYGCIIKIQRN